MSWLETRKLPLFFVAVTLLPIAVLCWLGVHTLEQDRDAASKRQRDRLEVAAGRVAIDIEKDTVRSRVTIASRPRKSRWAGGCSSTAGSHATARSPAPVVTIPNVR